MNYNIKTFIAVQSYTPPPKKNPVVLTSGRLELEDWYKFNVSLD